MKAIAIVPGTKKVSVAEVEEPRIKDPDDIKIKMIHVGICGTDREEADGGRADAPAGKEHLIIGHEMFGQVTETGKLVNAVKAGDYAVFTVRRGCNECAACKNGRSDMCFTGKYTERGIKGADGFQSAFVVDKEAYVVFVPAALKDLGVLTEPMSVSAKAIDEALIIQQARLRGFEKNENWYQGKKALVAGIGAIGLMAAIILRLKGCEVVGLDVVDDDTLRPKILKEIGGHYQDGRKVEAMKIDDHFGEFDFVFEATGIATLQIELIDCLAMNGIYVVTGIPSGTHPSTLNADSVMQQLVLKNQVLVGSVNAGKAHYSQAVEYLGEGKKKWPEAMSKLITNHVPYTDFEKVVHEHSVNEVKVVIDWQ